MKEFNSSKTWRHFLFLYLIVFLCFGYMTGSDWRVYELRYNSLDTNNLLNISLVIEPGYYLLTLFWKTIGANYWVFNISTKIICLILIIHQIEKYSDRYFYPSLAFFLALAGFYLFIDNPMRNLIAITIFLYSIPFLIKRNYLKYSLIGLFASTFHMSAFIITITGLLLISNFKIKTIVWVYVIFNIVILILDANTINNLIINIAKIFPAYEKYISDYILSSSVYIQGRSFSLGAILKIISFILIVIGRNRIEAFKYGDIIFNGSIIYLFLYTLGLNIPILVRFMHYYVIFYVIANSLVITLFAHNTKMLYWSFLFIVSLAFTYTTITSKYAYIPYSNYISYIGKDKPNYNYRSDYNYIHSPYNTDISKH